MVWRGIAIGFVALGLFSPVAFATYGHQTDSAITILPDGSSSSVRNLPGNNQEETRRQIDLMAAVLNPEINNDTNAKNHDTGARRSRNLDEITELSTIKQYEESVAQLRREFDPTGEIAREVEAHQSFKGLSEEEMQKKLQNMQAIHLLEHMENALKEKRQEILTPKKKVAGTKTRDAAQNFAQNVSFLNHDLGEVGYQGLKGDGSAAYTIKDVAQHEVKPSTPVASTPSTSPEKTSPPATKESTAKMEEPTPQKKQVVSEEKPIPVATSEKPTQSARHGNKLETERDHAVSDSVGPEESGSQKKAARTAATRKLPAAPQNLAMSKSTNSNANDMASDSFNSQNAFEGASVRGPASTLPPFDDGFFKKEPAITEENLIAKTQARESTSQTNGRSQRGGQKTESIPEGGDADGGGQYGNSRNGSVSLRDNAGDALRVPGDIPTATNVAKGTTTFKDSIDSYQGYGETASFEPTPPGQTVQQPNFGEPESVGGLLVNLGITPKAVPETTQPSLEIPKLVDSGYNTQNFANLLLKNPEVPAEAPTDEYQKAMKACIAKNPGDLGKHYCEITLAFQKKQMPATQRVTGLLENSDQLIASAKKP